MITFKAYRANGGYQLASTLREAPERKSEMLDMLDKAALEAAELDFLPAENGAL